MAEERASESAAAAHLVEGREAACGAGDHHLSCTGGTGQAPVSVNKEVCGAAGVRVDEEAMVSTEEDAGGDEGATGQKEAVAAANCELKCTRVEDSALQGFSGETFISSVDLNRARIEDDGEKGLFDAVTGEEVLSGVGHCQVAENDGEKTAASFMEMGSEEDAPLASKSLARLIMNDHHLVTGSPVKLTDAQAALPSPVAVVLVDKVEEMKFVNIDEATSPKHKSSGPSHWASSTKSEEEYQSTSHSQFKECYLADSSSAPPSFVKQKSENEVPTTPIALLEEEEEAEVAPTSPIHLASKREDCKISGSDYNIGTETFSGLVLETAIPIERDGKTHDKTKLPNQSENFSSITNLKNPTPAAAEVPENLLNGAAGLEPQHNLANRKKVGTIPQMLNSPHNRKGIYNAPAMANPQNCLDLDRPEASTNHKRPLYEEKLETSPETKNLMVKEGADYFACCDPETDHSSEVRVTKNPKLLEEPVVEPDVSDDLAEDCAQEYPGSPMDLEDEGSQDACENPLTGENVQAQKSSARLAVPSEGNQSGSDAAGIRDPKVTSGICNGGIAETDVSTNQTYLSHGTAANVGGTEEDSSLPYSLEFEKRWKATQDNPSNFSAWTNLLDNVEQENYILAARKAYAAFFTRYPYCYGYWKKYADMERRFGNLKEAEEVCEQSLQAIPLSVDLWMHFITFLQETLDMTQPESVQRIRNVFEMALAAAGMEFHSDKLWESYINWEKAFGDLQAVTVLYDRVLATPTELYSHHFEKFKEHVTSNSPVDTVSKEEFVWLRSKLIPEAESTVNMGNGDELQVHEASEEAAEVEKKNELDLEKMKELIISLREQLYKQNEAEVSKRWTFEETIKRPYFHVKPLERAQLINWNNYLDFEIANGSHTRTIVLFERCIIACAQYEEFWLKYTKYLENHTVIGTRSVFQRSCLYHLPKKPNLHLLWAAFEERQGDIEQARDIMKALDEAVPGLAMVRLRRVSLERRAGNMEAAEAILRESVLESEGTSLATFYSIKLARQVLKVQKNLGKAREILQEALKKDPENAKLYLNLLEVEFSADPKHNEGNTIKCIESVLSSNLPDDAKIVFSQRRVEFLEDFGSSIHGLLTAYDDHQKLLKLHAPKRKVAENGTTEDPEEKKARVEEITSTPAVPAASSTPIIVGDTNTNQVAASAAYNYNNWYQNYGAYNYQNAWNYNYFPQS